jgi:hypothetical protein
MEPGSGIDHFETREPHLIEDGVLATKFTGKPAIHVRLQIREVLLNPAVIAPGKELVAETQIELWLFVIWKRTRFRRDIQRDMLVKDLLHLQHTCGLWNLAESDLVDDLVTQLWNLNLGGD